MAVITMRQMLEAGAHFGHQTRRWNPKMKRFIFGERNGIYIIDLEQTLGRVETAYGFVRDLVAGGGTILFVGTKKQAQDPVRSYAEKCGMPYVNERWLGGMLTNFETMSKRVGKMLEYERMQASGEFDAMIKKEALMLDRELTKLQRNLGGLRGMTKAPDAIFVLDTKKEHIAVTEANKLGIPVVAVVDTNVDPEVIQYPIPGNDDAIRSNSLFARVIADAVEEGRFIANKRNPAPPPPVERTRRGDRRVRGGPGRSARRCRQAQADRDARLAAAKEQSRRRRGATAGRDRRARSCRRQSRPRRRRRGPRRRRSREPPAVENRSRDAPPSKPPTEQPSTPADEPPSRQPADDDHHREPAREPRRPDHHGVHRTRRQGAARCDRRRDDGLQEGARGQRRRHRGRQAVAPREGPRRQRQPRRPRQCAGRRQPAHRRQRRRDRRAEV